MEQQTTIYKTKLMNVKAALTESPRFIDNTGVMHLIMDELAREFNELTGDNPVLMPEFELEAITQWIDTIYTSIESVTSSTITNAA